MSRPQSLPFSRPASIRRHGASPSDAQNYRHRPGVYAILPRDGELLVTWQGAPHEELQLPGGGVDPGESPLVALHREVYEETGWKIAAPRRLGAFRRFVWMPEYEYHAEKVCHVYIARPVLPLGPPTEPAHEAVWVDPATAAELLGNAGDRAFVAALLRAG